jgi:hypothetical protein
MAGIIIPIISKTVFDYSFLASGTSRNVVLAPAIDVSQFKSSRLLVRVHDRSINGDAKLEVILKEALPSNEDTAEFLDSALSMIATVTPTVPVNIPGLLTDTESVSPAFWKVTLTASGPTSGPAVSLYAVLSVALLVRES